MLSTRVVRLPKVISGGNKQLARGLASLSDEKSLNEANPTDLAGLKRKAKRRPTKLADELKTGPSFADFVTGKAKDMLVDPLELARNDPNARLPSWLKTQIPKGKS